MDYKALGICEQDFDRQCELELKGHDMGRERYLHRVQETQRDENKDNLVLIPEQRMLHQCMDVVVAEIQKKLDKKFYGKRAKTLTDLTQNIAVLGPERLAFLALRHAMNISANTKLVSNCVQLGRTIQYDLEYYYFKQLAPGYLSKVEQGLKTAHLTHRHKVLQHAARNVKILDENGNIKMEGLPVQKWSEQERYHVGQFLLEIIVCKTDLLEIRHLRQKNKTDLVFCQTEVAYRLLETKHKDMAEIMPIILPSVVPPKPWTDIKGGVFWTQHLSMRAKLIRGHFRCSEEAKKHGLTDTLDTLNSIQNTAFRVNTAVLDVLKDVQHIGIGGLPMPDKNRIEVDGRFPLAEETPFTDDEFKIAKQEKDPRLAAWLSARAQAYDLWYRQKSKRTALLWKIKIADMFKDEPRIYFGWNLDYRGRIYPLQPYLNPQQDDVGKSLLLFAESQPLGEHGGYWLRIHGANVWGEDKAPMADRIKWVHDHEDQIMAVADNPLDNIWWADADKPYQFLAFCFEYANLKRFEGKEEDYESSLPVNVDGTCSGLQHFSALLRDEIGGKSVNLVPGETKADVYQEVANVVNRLLEKDKANNEFARAWLKRGVDRKTVKRNVMTFCYGATKGGFSQQLIDDITDKPEGVDGFKACHYLARINWKAVEQTLVKSVEAMKYLQALAQYVSKQELHIQWTTPTGLRVTQDYRKTKSIRIETRWGEMMYKPSLSFITDNKDVKGNKNGIAPNFIHSMDAAHLVKTTQACKEKGVVDFSFVHDSFGCHAGHMQTMSDTLRETFVEMYQENWLAQFTKDLRSQLPAEVRPKFDKLVTQHMPAFGDLDVNEVQQSTYFFC